VQSYAFLLEGARNLAKMFEDEANEKKKVHPPIAR